MLKAAIVAWLAICQSVEVAILRVDTQEVYQAFTLFMKNPPLAS
jgi:hypothetical protein